MQYLFQIIYFFIIFNCTTQIQPYLKAQGFDLMQCAYFYSGAAFGSYILQSCITKYHHNVKMNYLIKLGLGLFLILFWMLEQSICVFVSAVLLFALSKYLININEACCFKMKRQYGLLRVFAAIGMSLGAICSIYRYHHLFYILIGLYISLLFMNLPFNDKQNDVNISFKWQVKDIYFISMLALLYAIGCADQYIVKAKIIALKGNTLIIGWKMALQCLSEIPFYCLMNKLMKKFPFEKIMTFSILCFGLRFGLYGFFDNVISILWVSLLQAVSLPLMMSASKYYILKLHPHQQGTQLKMLTLFTSIALIVAPLLYGLLQIIFTFDVILYGCALGCVVALMIQRKIDK